MNFIHTFIDKRHFGNVGIVRAPHHHDQRTFGRSEEEAVDRPRARQ